MYHITAKCGFPRVKSASAKGVTVEWSETDLDWDER